MAPQRFIDRPPRIQPELPQREVDIPSPPNKDENENQPILQVALPLLTIVGYVFVAALGRGRSPLLLLPMGLSVVASTALAYYSFRRGQKLREEKEQAYRERLMELRKEMTNEHDMQRRFYRYNYPEPATLLKIIGEAGSNSHSDQRYSGRLWERRTDDMDFGWVRLGVGARPSTVQYKLAQAENFDDPQTREAMRLAEDSRFVFDVPITVPLRQPAASDEAEQKAWPAQHAIGISGSKNEIYPFIQALLLDYITFHAPTDSRLYVLGSDASAKQWEWATHLPHCKGAKEGETLLVFEDDKDRQGDKEVSRAYQFLKGVRRVLDERGLRLDDESGRQDATSPFLLIIVDLLALSPIGKSLLTDLETEAAISLLVQDGYRLGAAVIFLVPSRSRVPSGCKAVIEIEPVADNNDSETAERNRKSVGFRYAEVGVNSPRYLGQTETIGKQTQLKDLAQLLEPLVVRKSYGADLPPSVSLLEMFKVDTLDALRDVAAVNWHKYQQPKEAEWLRVPLGVLSGGDVRRLAFSADADGVHGMIAGSTGSGKSELLTTLILGLALNYDPSIINFVLVDFKGGSAFDPFQGKLPHCVDIVTNLSTSAVDRMFAAITAELNRRQALNVATNSKHIVHYRARGLHLPPYGQEATVKDVTYRTSPYPHLFIIIDEFAEMMQENPDYKAQLNSITRLGRSLGVTLILAAQRPSGVTDQMRANIKFRICLRVETREESSEVLRRPDAAYLPTGVPGRGYLQVGNENIELIQVGYSGADYTGRQRQSQPNVIWRNRPGKTAGQQADEESPKVFEVVIDMINELAKEKSLPQRKPWPDFLPDNLSLQTPVDTSYMSRENVRILAAQRPEDTSITLNSAVTAWLDEENNWPPTNWGGRDMKAIVGLVDNPYQAEQLPLLVDLPRGHAVIFGASGWGKTTFLRTLILSLAALHSPEDLHVYVLDFGGRNLSMFRELPHVGAIIAPDEEERVQRLLRRLDSILDQRKKTLSHLGIDDLYSYNATHPESTLPAILVIIDNFAEFKESFEDLVPPLTSLVRESRAYGIHFVVSADQPGSIAGKLYGLFSERMALKLSDPTEYSAIVGRGVRSIDDIPGRGVVKIDRRALEFQVALPVGETIKTAHLNETQRLLRLIERLDDAAETIPDDKLPVKIEILPGRVELQKLLPELAAPGQRHLRPVVGLDDAELQPWPLNLSQDGPHFVIIGPPATGKTTALRSLIISLAHTYSPQDLMMVLVDLNQQRLYKYGDNFSLGDLPHVADTIGKPDQLKELVENLKTECDAFNRSKRARRIVAIIDNYDSFSEEDKRHHQLFEQLADLARDYGTDGLHFVIGGSTEALRTTDELRKQIQPSPRFGLAMQSADAATKLNGRVPRSVAIAEMPLGRGFIVKSGRTSMLQVATPYDQEDDVEASLDSWVERIQKLYPNQKATWLRLPDTTSNGQPSTTIVASESSHPLEPVRPEANGHPVNLEALRRWLGTWGLTPDIVGEQSVAQMVETVQGMLTSIDDVEQRKKIANDIGIRLPDEQVEGGEA